MRKDHLIVCLLIALGFALDCTQANTSVADASSEKLASATPIETSSVLASPSATSRIDGYRDFKFGMKVPELVAVLKKVCEHFDDVGVASGTVFGNACYEIAGEKRDLKFQVSSPPGSPENETREKVLDLIVVKAGPYSKEYLHCLDDSLLKNYQKTVQMSKRAIQQVEEGSKYRTGNLYAEDQVALVLQHDKGTEIIVEGKVIEMIPKCLCIVMYYSTPELARTLHFDLKKPE